MEEKHGKEIEWKSGKTVHKGGKAGEPMKEVR